MVADAVTPKTDSQLRTTKRYHASSLRRYAALSRMWSIFTHTNSTSSLFSRVANAVTPTRMTCINTPAVSEEVNAVISGYKQAGREAELCAPGFQLVQVRGTLAHMVNPHPHQLNLVILLSGGQCSDAYKKRLSTKNNEETPGFQLAQVRGTLAHVVNPHPNHLNLPISCLENVKQNTRVSPCALELSG